METLWMDLVNTDWHDNLGTGQDEDRLLRPGWIEYLLECWEIEGMEPAAEETVIALQQLRVLIRRMIQAFLENRQPEERDIAALNAYFEHAPSRLLLTRQEDHLMLAQIPYQRDWPWILSRIAASFASVLVEHDPLRIKQCENPSCRYIYYDKSSNKSRRWCDESCANVMRVRRFRLRHRHA
jgi:predicted RNA-binding Zn ribbon-like protein